MLLSHPKTRMATRAAAGCLDRSRTHIGAMSLHVVKRMLPRPQQVPRGRPPGGLALEAPQHGALESPQLLEPRPCIRLLPRQLSAARDGVLDVVVRAGEAHGKLREGTLAGEELKRDHTHRPDVDGAAHLRGLPPGLQRVDDLRRSVLERVAEPRRGPCACSAASACGQIACMHACSSKLLGLPVVGPRNTSQTR